MITKLIIPSLLILFVSCTAQPVLNNNIQIENAKWYYYSYAMVLKAYDTKGKEVQPLESDLKVIKITKNTIDTINVFFIAYKNDTQNIYFFKPLNLVGIMIVRNKLYLPIYHSVVFDAENDSTVLKRMFDQDLLLRNKVLNDKKNVNTWLQEIIKKR